MKLSVEAERILTVVDANPKMISHVFESRKTIVIDDNELLNIYSLKEPEFSHVLEKIKEEIKTRPEKRQRVERWECFDFNGNFKKSIGVKLLNLRKNIETRNKKSADKRALTELCNANNVELHMGELFLNELKLSASEGDERAKQQAKLLGLI